MSWKTQDRRLPLSITRMSFISLLLCSLTVCVVSGEAMPRAEFRPRLSARLQHFAKQNVVRHTLSLRGGAVLDEFKHVMGPESNIVEAVAEKLGRNLHNTPDHPLQIIKSWIVSHFDNTFTREDGTKLFTSLDSLSPIVTTQMCFDDLLTPLNHTSRSRKDSYYVDDGHVLRSHMTAHQTTLLREGRRAFLYSGDVYRRDTVDARHYFCFHQMDAVRVFSWEELGVRSHEEAVPLVMADLREALAGMVKAVFGDVEMRWVESYFPFTEPSLELEIFFNGDWLEVLGCGVMRQQILRNGALTEHTGWAFGLGLERLAMVLFQVPDIRLFWSKDSRFRDQFTGLLASGKKKFTFSPYSKYPVCYKDVAFWCPEDLHDNDVSEVVRQVAGDTAEDVQLVDEFVHPKTLRRSKCFRVSYRSMDRTLTNAEVDEMQWQLVEELKAKLHVEIR